MNASVSTIRTMGFWGLWIATLIFSASSIHAATGSFADKVNQVQPKIVKLYGAGGLRGLEAYQTGILISADGHILTAWSYVLDTEGIRATLHDGRSYEAEVVGVDPWLEIAILKIPGEDLCSHQSYRPTRGFSDRIRRTCLCA